MGREHTLCHSQFSGPVAAMPQSLQRNPSMREFLLAHYLPAEKQCVHGKKGRLHFQYTSSDTVHDTEIPCASYLAVYSFPA